MNIIVCIKQVPTTEVKIDWESGNLIRGESQVGLNRYDLYAIEAAIALKDEYGGTVTALTMGPASAKTVLTEAISMGADEGILLSDKYFAGADVFATSFTLSQAVRKIGKFDLILCGQQTSDGDTAQVPPSVASWLDVPVVSWVKSIDKVEDDRIIVTATISGGRSKISCKLPCVLSVEEGANTPRNPTLKGKLAAKNKEIVTFTLSDLPIQDENKYGLKGSPTRVVSVYSPNLEGHEPPQELSADIVADNIFNIIAEIRGNNNE